MTNFSYADLNDFQNQCREQVLKVFNYFKVEFTAEVAGEREPYEHMVTKEGLELYIYLNELGMHADRVDFSYEIYDFDSEEEMILAFIQQLKAVVVDGNIRPVSKSTAKINLFSFGKI